MTTVGLVIPSEIRLIDLVHNAAEQIARLAGFDDEQSLNVGIAVREAVINAITHGNEKDPARSVEITMETGAAGVTVKVCDQGSGFDPDRTPDPTAEDKLLEAAGRGLLMIRAFVDDVHFRHRQGRGMEVTLVKQLRPDAGP